MFRALTMLAALGWMACGMAAAQGQDAAAGKGVAELVEKLDAQAFADREAAQKKLVEVGEPAVEALKKAVAESKSAEVRQRGAAALKEIEKALVRKSAVKIADIVALAKDADKGKVDAEKMELLLERLMEILAKDTGTERKLPVRFGEVAAGGEGGGIAQRKLILLGSGRVSMVRNSIVIASSIAEIAHAQDSVIVAGTAVQISHVENCVVITGEHLSLGFARGSSTLLTGGDLSMSHSDGDTILGAALRLRASHSGKSIYLNRPVPADRGGIPVLPPGAPAELRERFAPPRSVTSEGIVLAMPAREEPLKGLLSIVDLASGSSGPLLLFRRSKTGGEYFARAGQELKSPEGEVLPELAGWKVEHVGGEFAVLAKDGKRTVLRRPLEMN